MVQGLGREMDAFRSQRNELNATGNLKFCGVLNALGYLNRTDGD